jgi:hypothetical protein
MSGWRKRQIMEMIEMDDVENIEKHFAESITVDAAEDFLNGEPDWNKDVTVYGICKVLQYDYDFVWLASRVLFESAVVYLKAGKVI